MPVATDVRLTPLTAVARMQLRATASGRTRSVTLLGSRSGSCETREAVAGHPPPFSELK
jgi:hypothetical protein